MRRLALALLLALLGGCVWPAPPGPMPPAPPPIPGPVDPPEPPTPLPGLDAYRVVKVGDPEEVVATLPGTPKKVPVGDRTIYSWTTNVPRATGGFVEWEVVVQAGVVLSSRPW